MDYYFRTEKMSVGYGKRPLIEQIEIGLNKGEILTLIGPNGAGKSTVLKSIAKQLALLDGTVYVDNKSLQQMSGQEVARSMSVVFTEKLRTELMTCEEVVATGRYPYTGRFGILTKTDRRIVQEAMEQVHVKELAQEDFARISDGQRQRVMLARCLCQEPKILILDEPTSYLDIRYKLDFLSTLQEMQKQKGITVILSLHELELAQKISDKVLCLKGSSVDRYGTPEEVFKPGYIRQLFQISEGSFEELTGNAELPAAEGVPRVFVIGGGGSGIPVYRSLQRQGIPFAAGILFPNDLEYPVAQALAAEVVGTDAFEPVTEEQWEHAGKVLEECEKVICCKESFGTLEEGNKRLLEHAKLCKKKIEMHV